jgi:hypothetical protein
MFHPPFGSAHDNTAARKMQAGQKNAFFSLTTQTERNKMMMYGAFPKSCSKEVAVMDAGSSTGAASPLICGTASDVPLWRPTLPIP